MEILHLRFDCEALTPLNPGGWLAGNYLRGALGAVMQRAVCPDTRRRERPDSEHAAACPACWLLAAETEPGVVRRAYALVPPLLPAPETVFAPGERFAFGLSLFGEGLRFLPYFVLAVPEAGREGFGPGRGRFALRRITAHQPLTGERQTVLAEGEGLVRVPALIVTREAAWAAAGELLGRVKRGRVGLRFLTPTRLTAGDRNLVKMPDFGVIFARLVDRLEALHRQFGREWPQVDVPALRALADRVRLLEAEAQWIELMSGSGRTGRPTPMSGLVGYAVYHSHDWETLLPWLVWGQAVQVGKDVVKGNGWYEIVAPGLRRYGSWLVADSKWRMANGG